MKLALGVGVLVAAASAATAQGTTVPAFCSSYPQTVGAGQWQSSRVFYTDGRLTYVRDSEQNRIPDYSYAGYRYGQVAIPSVPEVMRLTPVAGDNTARIQQALDQVGARTPDARGLRGALVLAPGTYEIRGTVRVNRGGVVLRGSGDGSDAGSTILRATGDSPHQRPVVAMGSGSSSWTESATRSNITTSLVTVGSRSFDVASSAAFAVGDTIVVHHPSTQAWINAIDGGGMVAEADWSAGSVEIVYWRRITAIAGNTVTIDAPVFNHLNRSLSQSYIAKATSNFITEAGVESLRIDIVTSSATDENHAWNGVDVNGAHDSWIRGVTALHFGSAGIVLENAVRVTVENCRALDPHAVRTGGRMYNFNNESRSQLNLFTGCEATLGRHGYISNGTSSSSGLVYHRSSQRGGGSEAGHRRWTQGMLYDNITEQSAGQVLLINRGDFGTSHGWGTAHSTIWKYNSEMLAQKPPTAQNYAFSSNGSFRSSVYFPGPFGVQQMQSGTLIPTSLYEAQLCERLEGIGPTPTPSPTPTPGPTPTPTATATPGPTPTPGGPYVEVTPGAAGVTASTNDGNLPGNTVDNSLSTRWSGSGDGAWIRFDLGSVRTVGHVRVAAHQGNLRRNRFDVQVSLDNMSWDTVRAGAQTSGTTTAEEEFDFDDVPAQWVRYLGHAATLNAGGTSPWNSVAEVSIFALASVTPTPTPTPTPSVTPTPTPSPSATPTPTPTPTSTPMYVEVTPGASSVTASTHDGNVPGNTVDNSLATRWSANGDGQWIQIDLGTVRTVGHVRIATFSGNTRRGRFDLQVSTGGGVWTNVLGAALTSGSTTAEETFDFDDVPAQHVRYLGHGNTDPDKSTWNSVSEISVFAVP
jgi:hypothetical protein